MKYISYTEAIHQICRDSLGKDMKSVWEELQKGKYIIGADYSKVPNVLFVWENVFHLENNVLTMYKVKLPTKAGGKHKLYFDCQVRSIGENLDYDFFYALFGAWMYENYDTFLVDNDDSFDTKHIGKKTDF